MIYNNELVDTQTVVESSQKILGDYAKDWKIFIDTCSLLHGSADAFWQNISPYLAIYKNKVIVPKRVIDELEKHRKNDINLELAAKAKIQLMNLKHLVKADMVEIRGEQSDNFADNVFQVVFTKFRLTYKLLLITQDNDLAYDIEGLNKSKSVIANNVNVRRLNDFGYFSKHGRYIEESSVKSVHNFNVIPKKKPDVIEVFRICTKVTDIEDVILNVTEIPTENDIVYTTVDEIRLKKEIAAGGEGIIYTTNTSFVAKIYKKENITRRKVEKIKRIISKGIEYDGICFPVTELYNQKHEFVGYLMPEAKGKELQKSIFIKPLFKKNFPNWRKRDTVELCISILEKIEYLHMRNIIMGDINPSNIMVVSPKEVYFVDTDSYQIEDFPCPVGTINYSAPEIQQKHFSDFLRTIGNENFAVATLLFMIMLPGKPPYSQQGGEDPIANIINMDFSYPFGDSSNKKTPDGPWKYIWSHLTYELKEAFYNTFRINEKCVEEDKRLPVDKWLRIFNAYLNLLDSGKYSLQDPMSEELFPERHKKNPNVDYIPCQLCGMDMVELQSSEGICHNCLNKGDVYPCMKCKREIIHNNYEKHVKKTKPHDLCSICYAESITVVKKSLCIVCRKVFEITKGEYDYHKQKGHETPKRCKACRKLNKNK